MCLAVQDRAVTQTRRSATYFSRTEMIRGGSRRMGAGNTARVIIVADTACQYEEKPGQHNKSHCRDQCSKTTPCNHGSKRGHYSKFHNFRTRKKDGCSLANETVDRSVSTRCCFCLLQSHAFTCLPPPPPSSSDL